jgi:uncharacterized protein (DUF2267 family)
MDKRGFYARVRDLTGFDQSDAEFVTQASITVLGRILPRDQTDELALSLPEGLSEFLFEILGIGPAHWDEQEFWRQLQARCAITDPAKARRGFWAVIDVLRESAGDEPIERWLAYLPEGVSRETEPR